ncbi:MAG: family acetyltransferase [Proteobacteria bacterium]|nr:family acetyltransferase [Pseudomonadota bacterium]
MHVIRPETPDDVSAIRQITVQAFAKQPHSTQSEHLLVDALRVAGALCVSLVAEHAGEIIGHIAFSRVLINDADLNWYGLAPLSVSPTHQHQGIGTLLVGAGLACLDALSAQGCVVLGNPAYYSRFGFRTDTGLILDGVPAEYFMALPTTARSLRSQVSFHPAFALCGGTPQPTKS